MVIVATEAGPVQPLEETVTAYVPLWLSCAGLSVKLLLAEEKPPGPLQLNVGLLAVVVALNVTSEPTQALVVFVVTEGAGGAPGLVIE